MNSHAQHTFDNNTPKFESMKFKPFGERGFSQNKRNAYFIPNQNTPFLHIWASLKNIRYAPYRPWLLLNIF